MAEGADRKDRNWREAESMEDAARRLLAELDERAKRKDLAGRVMLEPAQIADQPTVSLVKAEKWPAPSKGVHAQGAGQHTTQGEDCVDHTARKEGTGQRIGIGGRADFSGGCFSFRGGKDTARPTLDEPLLAERANRHAPEDS